VSDFGLSHSNLSLVEGAKRDARIVVRKEPLDEKDSANAFADSLRSNRGKQGNDSDEKGHE
jgi:hypothetical protein